MPDPKPPTRPYLQALQYVSVRTGAPLSSLVVSFAILHEATAIVPFAAFFYASRQLGTGQVFVDYIRREDVIGESGGVLDSAVAKARDWTDEGEKWVGRVGRRYEIWGLKKGDPVDGDMAVKGLAGDVANAVVAYGLTKVCISSICKI